MNEPLNYGLFVGSNYVGTPNELAGCVNDATDLQKLFENHCKETKVLLDKEASRANILSELKRLIGLLDKNDTLIFSFSGHGTWKADTNGDEPDSRDEALCPDDFQSGLLVDDDLDKVFSTRVRGSKIVFLSDSCFSGTVFRLVGDIPANRRIKFIPPSEILKGTPAKRAEALSDKVASTHKSLIKTDAPKSGLIHLSGCLDTEFSYDATYNGRGNGAFTYSFIQAYNNTKPVGTWLDLWAELRKLLPPWDYPQTPRLNATSANRKMRVTGK